VCTTLTVLTRHNLEDVDYVLDLAESRGGFAAFQVLHHPPALAGAASGLAPSDAALRETLETILQAKRAGRAVLNSEHQLRALLAWPDFLVTRVHDPATTCLAGRLYGNVDADGLLYPCSLLVGEMPGASTVDGFLPAWEALGPSPCTRCTATAFAEYNRLLALDPGTVLDWIAAIA
jgi:MoaA/NifB/PqqE/SkfB family radical SAM enzyme